MSDELAGTPGNAQQPQQLGSMVDIEPDNNVIDNSPVKLDRDQPTWGKRRGPVGSNSPDSPNFVRSEENPLPEQPDPSTTATGAPTQVPADDGQVNPVAPADMTEEDHRESAVQQPTPETPKATPPAAKPVKDNLPKL